MRLGFGFRFDPVRFPLAFINSFFFIFFVCFYWFQPVLHHLGIPWDIYRGCTVDPNYQFTLQVLSQ